jgi:hypothetical protein
MIASSRVSIQMRMLSIRDEAGNISARSPLEEIQAAALRAAPVRCVAQHSVPPTDPQNVVRPCAHINIPTAITPRVTNAIQVRSLLFSANQSAIDEYAALLSLALCPCMTRMTRLLQLPNATRAGPH